MSKTIPSYLRLHRATAADAAATPAVPTDPVSRFWQAYTLSTGWAVQRQPRRRTGSKTAALRLMPAVPGDLQGETVGLDGLPAVSQDSAKDLAIAGEELAHRYQQSEQVIRRLQAELAVSDAPPRAADDGGSVSDSLQRLLAQTLEASGCDVAALYMLDEETTMLKLRASVGLPATRLSDEARPLRGSRADLECLVRQVVMIDDLDGALSATWNSPEVFPSAIVVRIDEADLPIGTLWMWTRRPRVFGDQQGAAATLGASAVAAELARAKLARKQHHLSVTSGSLKTVTQWQMRQLPPAVEIAPGLLVDGWTESPRPWACSWHAWDVLPDGTVALSLAEAEQENLDGAMIAATARAAHAAHSHYRHSVTDMLARVSDSLWQTNTGDQIVSMLYGHLQPETGDGCLAAAGSMQAIIVGPRGFRPLASGGVTDPLGSRIDGRFQSTEFRLQPGEVLVVVNRGVLDAKSGLTQAAWADCVRQTVQQNDMAVLPAIRRALADMPLTRERAGMMLLRQSP